MKYLIILLLLAGCQTSQCRDNPRHFDCVMGTKQFHVGQIFTWPFPPKR